MDTAGPNNVKLGSDSQDSDDVHPAGTSGSGPATKTSAADPKGGKKMTLTPKGVEIAKKRLRAFSIQKKSSLSPVSVPKPLASGGATVFIGKLSAVKNLPKPEPSDPSVEQKKLPKPPKPGAKPVPESYISSQKKTLAEIEDMKRKMELVELGIPLGLICPTPNSDKAMPTKAMPPIKSFLDPAIVDELIRDAKKARAEGKEYKLDYRKFLPDYSNPFQRKKDDPEAKEQKEKAEEQDVRKLREMIIKRRNEKLYDSRKNPPPKKSDKERHKDEKHRERPRERNEKSKDSDRSKDRDAKSKDTDTKSKEKDNKSKDTDIKSKDRDIKSKDRDIKSKDRDMKSKDRDIKSKDSGTRERDKKDDTKNDPLKDEREADVDLNDFVVCDSWSDNDEKSKDSTPKPDEKIKPTEENIKTAEEKTKPISDKTKLTEKRTIPAKETPIVAKIDPMEQLRQSLASKQNLESPKPKKLKPVIDSFKFEIDEEEEVLDIFDESSSIDKFAKLPKKKDKYDSPINVKIFDYDTKDDMDELGDETFLESVINEIKQEDMDETSQDKALVEYDESPLKDGVVRDSVTPEMDDRARERHSSRSDYSDGYKSAESCCKSIESGYRSTDSLKLSESYKSDSEVEKMEECKLAKYTQDSLETWSFVLKICQPLLFRHDKNKCYKETRMMPKLWFTENPKLCNCVKDRRVVYKELEMCKMDLVDSLYSATQVQEASNLTARGWYPRTNQCCSETNTIPLSSEWEAEDSQQPITPEKGEISLDKEYQRFMEAVWPEVTDPKSETPRSTPVRKTKADDGDEDKPRAKRVKLSSEGWSQESDVEDDKSVSKKVKTEKQKRKRKLSTSATESSETEAKKRKKLQKKKENRKLKSKDAKRRRVIKKNIKKLKEKQKKKKKKIIKLDDDSDLQDEKEKKKKEKRKLKKKKLLKLKKKNQKKKKARAKSSSSSSSDSSSDSESEIEKKSKKKKSSEKKKKRKQSTSESAAEELFDVNILNNIKTERNTDDENSKQLQFSPRRQKPREIINVKELQNDFVGNSVQIKQEREQDEIRLQEEEEKHKRVETYVEEQEISPENEQRHVEIKQSYVENEQSYVENEQSYIEKEQSYIEKEQSYIEKDQRYIEKEQSYVRKDQVDIGREIKHEERDRRHVESETRQIETDKVVASFQNQEDERQVSQREYVRNKEQLIEIKQQPEEIQPAPQIRPDESNNSQCSSQESIYSLKDQPLYEKDESHLRPSSQNSNYSFHDVMASKHGMEDHGMSEHGMGDHDMDMNSQEYEHGNYEMYEQMAMVYQSNVASQQTSPPGSSEQRIETVVRARACGEIKCDWRADRDSAAAAAAAAAAASRPSRWGLKPGDVNIVLTGGDQFAARSEPVYKIQSIANRTDNSATGYDEAYMDMYGASDKLQYGDCFSTGSGPDAESGREPVPGSEPAPGQELVTAASKRRAQLTRHSRSLDDRIDLALRTTVLGEVAKDPEETEDKEGPEKGILITKSLAVSESRGAKSVTFADGYKPGQDSDVEEPPVIKKKKVRRLGCAWPCPASHPDHVLLWDALPPPAPPAGSPPPPPAARGPPACLLRPARAPPALLPPALAHMPKFDPNSMAFMPPEPPPGMISFQNL